MEKALADAWAQTWAGMSCKPGARIDVECRREVFVPGGTTFDGAYWDDDTRVLQRREGREWRTVETWDA
jgi:hypothetical protein